MSTAPASRSRTRRLAAAALTVLLAAPALALAQAVSTPPAGPPPTLEQTRAAMGIPSREKLFRGQRDTVGYASHKEQMARVWELASSPPAPDSLGPAPAPGVAAILCPHDDYLYAGRVYRKLIPLVTAKAVVVIGTFHQYRRYGAHDVLVFDEPYRAWAAPDGPIPISPLRTEVLERLSEVDAISDMAMHDSEHSIEAIVYWLRHQTPGLEIVPILVPSAPLERFDVLADRLAQALHEALARRDWQLGRDVAIVISSDAVHYGADFKYTPYGKGGAGAVKKAVARDEALIEGPLAGPVTEARVKQLDAAFVDPRHPDTYRLTWCGRFAVPFGLLVLNRLAALSGQVAVGHPVTYSTSVAAPPLPVKDLGLGATAPATTEHFVGYPGVAFTMESAAR